MNTVSEGLERTILVDGSQRIYIKAPLIAALREEARGQLDAALVSAWKGWEGLDLEDVDGLNEFASEMSQMRAALSVLRELAPLPAESSTPVASND